MNSQNFTIYVHVSVTFGKLNCVILIINLLHGIIAVSLVDECKISCVKQANKQQPFAS